MRLSRLQEKRRQSRSARSRTNSGEGLSTLVPIDTTTPINLQESGSAPLAASSAQSSESESGVYSRPTESTPGTRSVTEYSKWMSDWVMQSWMLSESECAYGYKYEYIHIIVSEFAMLDKTCAGGEADEIEELEMEPEEVSYSEMAVMPNASLQIGSQIKFRFAILQIYGVQSEFSDLFCQFKCVTPCFAYWLLF